MILRRLARRCPRALAQNSPRQPRRFLSTEAESISDIAQNSVKNLQTIHEEIDSISEHPEPALHVETRGTASLASHTVAEEYYQYKQLQKKIGKLGADTTPHYQPHTLLNNPPSPADVTLQLLLASEAHQGHVTSNWNPANARYIHGIRQGVHIISLEVTAAHLRRAAKVVQEVCKRGGMVLFVGTRDGQDRAVAKAAEMAKGYHLFERWIPGSITNGQQILGRCKTKVVDELDKEISGYEEQLFDRSVLRPDLVVCLNPLENYVLLHECALNNIPTIGVIDTNADPTWVTYPIPANDDSLRCIQVIAGVLGRAGEQGQKQRLALAEKGIVTYKPADLHMPEKEEIDGVPATSTDGKAETRKPRRDTRRVDQDATAVSAEELVDERNLEEKLDEVRNHEDHRTKEGRALKISV